MGKISNYNKKGMIQHDKEWYYIIEHNKIILYSLINHMILYNKYQVIQNNKEHGIQYKKALYIVQQIL